jgi:hypothetical protein
MDAFSGDLFFFALWLSGWVAIILFRQFHHHDVAMTDIEAGPHHWGRYEDKSIVVGSKRK